MPLSDTSSRTMFSQTVTRLVAFASVLWLSNALAQEQSKWQIKMGTGYAGADGSFRTQRANGKIVTSDINAGVVFSLRVEHRLSRRVGLEIGGLGLSQHDFIIHQDFPDGTEFEARDSFRFKSVLAGVAVHMLLDQPLNIVLEPFLMYAWYNDVSPQSAGPPFDRTVPLDVDVKGVGGIGLIVAGELTVSRHVNLNMWTGLAAVRFTGPFPDDPAIAGSGGDIGVRFSPLMAGLGFGFKL